MNYQSWRKQKGPT